MPAARINVHFHIRHIGIQHRAEPVVGPDRVHLIAPTRTHDERRRRGIRNCRRFKIRHSAPGRERCGSGINHADEIRTRRDLRKRITRSIVLLVELLPEYPRRRRQLRARRESHDPDLVRVDLPLLRVSAHDLDRLLRVVDRVRLRIVTVAAHAIAQDHRVDAVVAEIVHKVRAFSTDVQRVVPAARHHDHHHPRVERTDGRVKLDRGIVNAHDARDPTRPGAIHRVNFGLLQPVLLQIRRIRREKGHNHAARQNGLRLIRLVRRRRRFRDVHRRGQSRERHVGSGGSRIRRRRIDRKQRAQPSQQTEHNGVT